MTYVIDAKTARGAANQLKRAIQDEITKVYGKDDPSVLDVKVTDAMRGYGDKRKNYTVTWENGPFEWAVIGSMEGDIWAEEMTGELSYDYATFKFPAIRIGVRTPWIVEAGNAYQMVVCPTSW